MQALGETPTTSTKQRGIQINCCKVLRFLLVILSTSQDLCEDILPASQTDSFHGFPVSQPDSVPGSLASSRNTTPCNSDDEEADVKGPRGGKAKKSAGRD